MRFIATLAAGQALTISVPGKFGESGEAVEISRGGDKVLVIRQPVADALGSVRPEAVHE